MSLPGHDILVTGQLVGQPQGQAIDDQQTLGAAVAADDPVQCQRFLDRAHARQAGTALFLVTFDAMPHLVVTGLGGGHEGRLAPRSPLQPLLGQLLGPPRLPAALPAQDQLMPDRRDEGQAR